MRGAAIPMSREILKLDCYRFTKTSACAREVLAPLENSDYKIVIRATAREIEELTAELEDCKALGRIAIERLKVA